MGKVLIQYFTSNLALGVLLLVIGILAAWGLLIWFFKLIFKAKHERFTQTPSISSEDLSLMKKRDKHFIKNGKRHPTPKAEKAEKKFRKLPIDEQDKLENKYELYQEIKRLSEHGWLNNYRHLAARVLAFLSRMFSESHPFNVKESLDYQPHVAKTAIRTLSHWFTFESYLILLFVALMYPAVLASLNSVFTHSIAIAGAKVLAFDSLGQVLVFLIALMASLFLVWQVSRGQRVKELSVKEQLVREQRGGARRRPQNKSLYRIFHFRFGKGWGLY